MQCGRSALREAIFVKQRYKERYSFAASALTLYLAQKDGAWLKDDDRVEELLQGKIETAYKEMRSSWTLDEDYFGTNLQLGEDETHVLVQLPTQQTPKSVHGSSFFFRDRELLREMAAVIKEAHASLPFLKPYSCSDARMGQMEASRLKKDELMIDASVIDDEDAFWSNETQHEANGMTNKAVFDAFVTPFLSEVLASCGMVLVRYQWLSRSPFVAKSTDLRPDDPSCTTASFYSEASSRTAAAFGQAIRYLQNLSVQASASAILFDRRSFWLIKSYKTDVVKVQNAVWVNKGSKSIFRKFITTNMCPWVVRLTCAYALLGVDVVEDHAFLGRGAYGRVFKVIGHDGEVFALKIAD